LYFLAVRLFICIYIMIYARRTRDAISITNTGIRKVSFSFTNPGGFNSSDELLNSIWMTGAHRLDATYDYTYRDSGTGIDGQLLGNAMIQAIASNFLLGDFPLSAKGLREFAEAQLPTGEFRAMAPTDDAVRRDDHALRQPVWLQKHVLHTDERRRWSRGLRQTSKTCSTTSTASSIRHSTSWAILTWRSMNTSISMSTGLTAVGFRRRSMLCTVTRGCAASGCSTISAKKKKPKPASSVHQILPTR
jgi:hypothetical protein